MTLEMGGRKRIDILAVEKGLAESRQKAQALVMAGKILIDGRPADKPGTQVFEDVDIQLRGDPLPFVSRGGTKLQAALDAFGVSVQGLRCLDVGAATGGFTDCLLQRGATHVTAIDVGYGQIAWALRTDPRVKVLERTNIRHVSPSDLGEPFDLAVIDVSFISLRLVVPVVQTFLSQEGRIIVLIKPQFEVGKGQVGKGGVVRDAKLHQEVIESLSNFFNGNHLNVSPVIPSPILGPKGNKEFLASLTIA
jgi:23S rRNA (cytidine1920-2'-O)/16S rRNA (cytidine1409-2'-O)-methyltransferase